MKKAKPPIYEIKAFLKGKKPGVYEVWSGEFHDGRFVETKQKYRGWRWRRFFRKFNRVLRKYHYVSTVVEVDGKPCTRFYISHDNPWNITAEMLQNVQEYHREIGRGIGIPEFAVRDFVERKQGAKLVKVKIRELGLIFTVSDSEQNLASLDKFLMDKHIDKKDAEIVRVGA